MPRDIQVFVEKKVKGRWCLVLPLKKYPGYNHEKPEENRINETMYIPKWYPELFYDEYDQDVWELFGIKGKYSENELKGLPDDLSLEIAKYHQSFGLEAFDEHWISCSEFIENAKRHTPPVVGATNLISQLQMLGNSQDMRFIMWFSQ